jgi:hypothetical protein
LLPEPAAVPPRRSTASSNGAPSCCSGSVSDQKSAQAVIEGFDRTIK